MSETPMSPRERLLREDEQHSVSVLPTAEERQQAADAAAEARESTTTGALAAEQFATPLLDEAEGPGEPEPPEVFTVQELEQQLTRLEMLQQAEGMPLHEQLQAADDALQGIAVVLAMGFSGDVQMIVLAALQRYRTVHGYTG